MERKSDHCFEPDKEVLTARRNASKKVNSSSIIENERRETSPPVKLCEYCANITFENRAAEISNHSPPFIFAL